MNNFFEELKNAFKKRDNGLMQIITINIIVFLFINIVHLILWLGNADALYKRVLDQFSVPASLTSLMYRPWTLVTYLFTHEGIFHILFNMLFLYWFGKIIVEYLGNKRLVNVYVLGGLIGAFFYLALYNFVPRLPLSAEMIGASGGVYAVMVAAATLRPNLTFYLLLLGPVRIKYIAGFFVLLSFIQLPQVNAGGNAAHLGGALIGYMFISQLRKGNDLGAWITNFLGWLGGLFRRKPKMKVTYVKKEKVKSKVKVQGNGESMSSAAPNQDEIDRILDKISASGYASLTKEEKQRLLDASRD
ncbi:MAG: rhomboid family intramembrane serine protease [Thermonemataceae bacterium]